MNDGKRYWLTPPSLELEVRRIIGGDYFDPCPYPRGTFDALADEWQKPWYLNPPFTIGDGGPIRFIRRAIQIGGPGVAVFSVNSVVDALLRAGVELHPLGRVKWLECETKEPMPSPGIYALAVFKSTSGLMKPGKES
jgi:hypothetical protein